MHLVLKNYENLKCLSQILLKAKKSTSLFMQCAKLSFVIRNFKKRREVMVLNFFNLVLKKSMENDF